MCEKTFEECKICRYSNDRCVNVGQIPDGDCFTYVRLRPSERKNKDTKENLDTVSERGNIEPEKIKTGRKREMNDYEYLEPEPEPEIGSFCRACYGEMYKIEECDCKGCGKTVHHSCEAKCANPSCGHEGCRDCLTKDEETDERFCSSDCIEQYKKENPDGDN